MAVAALGWCLRAAAVFCLDRKFVKVNMNCDIISFFLIIFNYLCVLFFAYVKNNHVYSCN